MGFAIFNPVAPSAAINRNFFKNPAFAVSQGVSSGTVTLASLNLPTASLGYPGEAEWCIAASGGSPTYAFSPTNQSLTLTGTTGTTGIYVLQRLESVDANILKSKQVTLSVEMRNDLLTSVTWELFYPNVADTHGTISTPSQTSIASGTWTLTKNLTQYSTTVTLPVQVAGGLEVRFRVGSQISGNWVIARPKLEEGSLATEFSCEDYAIELARCQRYFQVVSGDFYLYAPNASANLYQYLSHPGMFGTTRTRNLFGQTVYSGTTTLMADAGPDLNSTRITIGGTGTAAAYLGARPVLHVSAHIP